MRSIQIDGQQIWSATIVTGQQVLANRFQAAVSFRSKLKIAAPLAHIRRTILCSLRLAFWAAISMTYHTARIWIANACEIKVGNIHHTKSQCTRTYHVLCCVIVPRVACKVEQEQVPTRCIEKREKATIPSFEGSQVIAQSAT